MISEQQARQIVPHVLSALEQVYGPPPPPPQGDPLELCIRLVLHEDSSEKAATAALRKLQQDFVDWNEARISTPSQVSRALGRAASHDAKARAVLALLQAVFRARNEMSLEFLREAGPADARAFLEAVPELGPVLPAKILLLVFGYPGVVVSSEVARVSARLDWVRPDYAAEQARRRLDRLVPKASMASLYHSFSEHARNLCHAQSPKCRRCPILKLCPLGQSRRKGAGAAARRETPPKT